jgi:23S rRNA (adenine2030-N6)-methyltransferase
VLSYRHGYHAGNLADVLKHTVLCAVLSAATRKPSPLFYLETHAGAGRYRLTPNGEHESGIAELRAAEPLADAPNAVATLMAVVRADDRYPGSPVIAARLLRESDRMLLAELHPTDFAELSDALAGDPRATVVREDGYRLLRSQLPPRERRGVVLIDPNYELADEGARLCTALGDALARFRHGTYLVWLPLAGKVDARRLERDFSRLAPPKTLAVSLTPTGPTRSGALASAVWIVNPPFQAVKAVETAARYLADLLRGDARTQWLVPESS